MNAVPSKCGLLQGNWDFKLRILPDMDFNAASNTYCPFAADMPGTGGSICTLKGGNIVLGSAADLLCASRFMGFNAPSSATQCDSLDPGCVVYSTDQNTPWVVADFVISNQQSMSTVLQGRNVLGIGQLDLFLCSNSQCDSILDVQSVGLPVGNERVVAAGYSQISGTRIGSPMAYLNTSKLLSEQSVDYVLREDLARALPTKYQAVRVVEIVYKNDNRTWLLRPPSLLRLGTFSRMAHEGNIAWEKLRYGTYFATNLDECVGVITPVHHWMDAHGWDRSHRCGVVQRVFVFNNYFPQAYLDLNSKVYCTTSFNTSDGQQFCMSDTFGPLLSEAPRNSTWEPEFLLTDLDGPVHDNKTLMVYGNAVLVDSDGENIMTGTGPYLASSWWERCGFAKREEEGLMQGCQVLLIGRAAILAVDLSDYEENAQETTDLTDKHLEPVTGLDNQIVGNDPYTSAANKLFEELTSALYLHKEVPWCQQVRDIDVNYAWSRKAMIASEKNSSMFVDLFNCSMWDAWNFGYVDRAVNYSFEKATGLAERTSVRWFPINMEKFVLGFKSCDRVTSVGVNDSVQNMALDAAGKLCEQTSLALSLTDPTITWKGGFSMLAMTMVSVVAFNAGRRDLEELIHKGVFREGTSTLVRVGTYSLFAIVSIVVIALPATLTIVQEVQTRANGVSSSKVWWLQEQCLGYGKYTMLGALTMSFSPVFDDIGFGFLWANLVLAVVGAGYVLSRSKHAPVSPKTLFVWPCVADV